MQFASRAKAFTLQQHFRYLCRGHKCVHIRWLHFSNNNTGMGDRLWDVCKDFGLKQLVSHNRFDAITFSNLVFTDANDLCKVLFFEKYDDRVMSLDIEVVVSFSDEIPREVWQMKKTNWDQLLQDISTTHWQALFDDQDPDGSVVRFCGTFKRSCYKHIPRKTISTKIASHPGLDEACFLAVAEKSAAAGTSEFVTA